MNNDEIIAAFDRIIEQLNQIIAELRNKGADYLMVSDILGAKSSIRKIENVEEFKVQLTKIKNAWLLMGSDLCGIDGDNQEFLKPELTANQEHDFIVEKNSEEISGGPRRIILVNETKDTNDSSYDLNHHLHGKTNHSRELFKAIRQEIKEMAPTTQEKFNKWYIAYLDPYKYCEIHIQKEQLKIWITPANDQLNDPQHKCRDVRQIGHYGTGATEIIVKSRSDIVPVVALIKQSYTHTMQYYK